MQHQPDGRQDDVVDERGNDFPECRTDDDADGQINNVAPHGEFFEFFEHELLPLGTLFGACGDCLTRIIADEALNSGDTSSVYRGRKIRMEPIRPRKMSTRPANASRRPTHKKGTREIASITKPRNISESPRVHCSVRDHHCTGLNSARNPHKITATLSSNQPGFRRSNRICPVRPSHTTSPPSTTKIISMVIRSTCCGVSILCCDLCRSLANGKEPYCTRSIRTLFKVTGVRGRSLASRGVLEILSATSWPSTTSPKMVCLLSSQGVAATVRKNWLPLVPGPLLAMESFPALECFREG